MRDISPLAEGEGEGRWEGGRDGATTVKGDSVSLQPLECSESFISK